MSASFVFDDLIAMRTVLGANDGNVPYMENLLGSTIAVRGNKIELLSQDSDICTLFTNLMQQLVRLSAISESIGENEILMEVKALSLDEKTDTGKRAHITVGSKMIYPKSRAQEEYIKQMSNAQIIFAMGPAGTGKTFLAVNYCLGELLAGRKQKIILTRPVIEAGESLGFLPGDLSQKLNPYLKPLYDSMEATVSPSTVKRLEETGHIEIAPLAYMRGRSVNNACIILDEAQNTTCAQMKMFLTRLGENSTAIITGDVTQIDLPKSQTSGLIDAKNRLTDLEGIKFVTFTGHDTVRSRVVQRIINAYEQN